MDPKVQFLKGLSTTAATIFVGPNEVKYQAHEGLLSSYSDFFKAALRGPFKEGQDLTVYLPEVDPLIFNLFIQWLYAYSAWYSYGEEQPPLFYYCFGEIERATTPIEVAELLVLADFLSSSILQEQIEIQFKHSDKWPHEPSSPAMINFVYEHLDRKRNSFVYEHLFYQFYMFAAEPYDEAPEKVKGSFWMDLAIFLKKRIVSDELARKSLDQNKCSDCKRYLTW